MKRPVVRVALTGSFLLAAIGLTALALLQSPKIVSTTALARGYPAQSIEAVRAALERAINVARVRPSKKHTTALDETFRDYLAVVSTHESEILNRLDELEALLGTTRSTSSSDVSANLQRPTLGAKTKRLRAEYEELSARLESLRSEFGTANVEVNKIIGSRDQDGFSAAVATCNVLIVNGASTSSEPGTTSDATTTLSGIVTLNGGTVTISDPVPVSLAGFNVIYDIRFSPALSASDTSAYLSFLQGGGRLLLVGENGGFGTRNNSLISFVSTAGGGSLTYCDPGCQCAATCSDATLCSTPNTAATFSLPAPGGTTTSGNGTALLTVAGSCRPVSVFRPGQLTNATAGTLITFFDINTFQSAFGGGNDNLKLIGNIAAFFCGACSLTCPSNINVAAPAACPVATSAVVTFNAPIASGSCGTITCSPPSAASFPVGTTTVTCTASAGGSCSFTVTVFSACLQDDSNPGTVALFNSQTGAYRFCCGGTIFTGTGTVTVKGCIVTIQHNPADRRVLIKFDGGVNAGSASLQSPPGNIRCTITDRNTTNNSCVCQ